MGGLLGVTHSPHVPIQSPQQAPRQRMLGMGDGQPRAPFRTMRAGKSAVQPWHVALDVQEDVSLAVLSVITQPLTLAAATSTSYTFSMATPHLTSRMAQQLQVSCTTVFLGLTSLSLHK